MSETGGVIVVGGAGGIGEALLRHLDSTGTPSFIIGRREEPLRELAGELSHCGFFAADARDADALGEAFKMAANDFKARGYAVRAVVNLAGSILLKPAHRTRVDEYESVMDANLRTAFNTVRAAVPLLRGKGGAIVLMSSAAARHGFANHDAIAAAKAGVIGLTLSAAASYAPWNIRVNAVAPGLVETELSAFITKSEAARHASSSMHALGRIGKAEDVASMVAWLLLESTQWVSGQVFGVDGGLSTIRSR